MLTINVYRLYKIYLLFEEFNKLISKVIAPKIVEVSPNRTELIKICSLFRDSGIRKIREPASRGPNPAIATGNDANKKIPGTKTKIRNIFKFKPIE